MIQHTMSFHKIARTNHRNDFQFLAILLHLELFYCKNLCPLRNHYFDWTKATFSALVAHLHQIMHNK